MIRSFTGRRASARWRLQECTGRKIWRRDTSSTFEGYSTNRRAGTGDFNASAVGIAGAYTNTGAAALGWPVVDRTGLTGSYNLRLTVEIHADPDGRSGTWGVDYLTELPRQFGLRLSSARDDYQFLVIDQAEEPTPE